MGELPTAVAALTGLGDIAQGQVLHLDLRTGRHLLGLRTGRHAGRLAGRGSLLRAGLLLNPVVPAQCLRRLMQRLFGHRTSFRYDVTALTYQILVNRQMIVSS
ncbi:hypothetical protein ACI2L1_00080 [Streptomyces sp. NPDC019531]|uniref:hypothetical protein n=1 Tax=Streptomyces sp. NPDC019531 TaxID=3365062 RepID=UPI00384B1EA5